MAHAVRKAVMLPVLLVVLVLAFLGGGAVVVYNVFIGPAEFVKRLWAAFGETDLSPKAKAIAIAMAAFESGWGKGTAAKYGFNYWNITRAASDNRPIIEGKDTEPDGNGGWRTITQRFRKYANDSEAVWDYLDFLSTGAGGRYAMAYEYLLNGDAHAFLAELYRAGYYTLPVDQYTAGVDGTFARVGKELGKVGVALG